MLCCHVIPLWKLFWQGTAGDVLEPWSAAAERVRELVHRVEQRENDAEQASFVVVKDITLALKSFKDSAALCPSR